MLTDMLVFLVISILIMAAHLIWDSLLPAGHEKVAWKKEVNDRKICLIYFNNEHLTEYMSLLIY